MGVTRRWILVGSLALQLGLVTAASFRDLASFLGPEKDDPSPMLMEHLWGHVQKYGSAAVGESLDRSNPFRQALSLYQNCAGIENGNCFFAPNVPNTYKLVFEIQNSDGTTEIALPEVGGEAAGLRLTGLLENLGRIPSEVLRRRTLQKLAFVVWASHPRATRIRAIFGAVLVPDLAGYERGAQASYDVTSVYDFYPRAQELRP